MWESQCRYIRNLGHSLKLVIFFLIYTLSFWYFVVLDTSCMMLKNLMYNTYAFSSSPIRSYSSAFLYTFSAEFTHLAHIKLINYQLFTGTSLTQYFISNEYILNMYSTLTLLTPFLASPGQYNLCIKFDTWKELCFSIDEQNLLKQSTSKGIAHTNHNT